MTNFEKKLAMETGLSLDDLPDREEGYYDEFIDDDGEIDYEALMYE